MVSAGLDTVPGNLIMGIAYLSSAHGQEIQKRAYDEIVKVYPDGDAWEKCLVEEKVPYVTAFVREVLRFFTVIPICLPRTSIKDIKYENAVIPAGTTFYMVRVSHYSNLNHALLTRPRMHGQPTLTPSTSKIPRPSPWSGTLRTPKVPEHLIMLTELGLACALVLISPIASCILPLSG
jgi:hypothetical protein